MNTALKTKVPAVTFLFWAIKIFATTLGETAGDAVSMTMGFGYLAGTAIFAAALLGLMWMQIRARNYHPLLYWATIVASTTMGTTLADFSTRSIGIGYAGGSAMLAILVALSLWSWHRALGTISIQSVGSAKSEVFYWITITCSQTLGTAMADWVADSNGMGYGGAAMLFGGLLAALLLFYAFTRANRVALFWAAFILTRPFGAVVGDLLDKPLSDGGLNLSRLAISGLIALSMLVLIEISATSDRLQNA